VRQGIVQSVRDGFATGQHASIMDMALQAP